MNPELVATIEKLKQLREQNIKYNEMLAENLAKYKAGLIALEEEIRKTKVTYYLLTDPIPVRPLVYAKLKVA